MGFQRVVDSLCWWGCWLCRWPGGRWRCQRVKQGVQACYKNKKVYRLLKVRVNINVLF